MSDPAKRRQYDRYGSYESASDEGGFSHGTKAQDFTFNFDDLFKHFESDIFGDMDPGHKRQHFGAHFSNHFANMGGDSNEFDFEKMFENDADFFGFGDGDSFFAAENLRRNGHGGARQQTCKTVHQRIGNTVTTYTQCS